MVMYMYNESIVRHVISNIFICEGNKNSEVNSWLFINAFRFSTVIKLVF